MDAMDTIRTSLAKIEERTGKIEDIERRLRKVEDLDNTVSKLEQETRHLAQGSRRMSQAEMERLVADTRSGASADFQPRGGFGGGREEREHLDAFTGFLRAPKDGRAQATLAEIQQRASGATDAGGGFIIPDMILGPLLKRASNSNPFRSLVRTVQVATRDISFPLSGGNMGTGWVAEDVTRTATTEPTLAAPRPTFGMLYSYVAASEELVMDSQFDVANWFAMEAGDAMAETEMVAIVSGDGVNKPSGLLRVAPEATADGSRTAGALRYIATGDASTLGSNVSDKLIDMVYDLRAAYRSRGTWAMNSAVASQIRKLKDSTGRFLWTDGLAAGQPSTLLGYPVAIAESMPGVVANAHPIAFGDFERAYILCENGGLRVTVDDNITVPGRVKWYIRRRLGGIVYNNDAVRVLKVALS